MKKSYINIFLLLLIVGAGCANKSESRKTIKETTMEKETFDYIVIGTGPAGSVVANRLSADGKNNVLVLEAGENNDKNPLIIGANTNLYAHYPEFFWPGQGIAQEKLGGKSMDIGHGRTSGGGSSINGEMYVRPSAFVLKKWEEIAGDKWNLENVTKHFKELENFHGEFAETDVHGYKGDLHIRQPHQRIPALTEKLLTAMENATGLKRIDDYNDPRTPIGPFARFQIYQKPDGSRASASVCFLDEETRKRPNLTVLNQATATKVLFSEDKKAIGVEYIHNGVGKQALANKKIIVSAGIHSVQLLMLSGIGPRETLDKFNIPVVYDNKNVGANLEYDNYITAQFNLNLTDAEELNRNDPNGKYAGGAFLPDPRGPKNSGQRSIQIVAMYKGNGVLSFSILQVNTKSHGVSSILSSDPLKMISLDYQYLTDPDDMDALKSMFRNYIARIGEELHKIDPAYELIAPTKEELADDEKLARYIITNLPNSFHDQCSLRMGKESEGGVVNSSGEVYGVKNLVVADASIIPYHTDGNTSAPAYVIGAVIAEDILSK